MLYELLLQSISDDRAGDSPDEHLILREHIAERLVTHSEELLLLLSLDALQHADLLQTVSVQARRASFDPHTTDERPQSLRAVLEPSYARDATEVLDALTDEANRR